MLNRKLQPFEGFGRLRFFCVQFENRQLYLSLKTLFDNSQN